MEHLIRDKMYVSLRWRVVLSACAQIQMDQSELRMRPLCERPFTRVSGKPKRWILRQSFRCSRVFRPPKHTYLEWNLLGFIELLFFFAIRDFSCWGENDLWSDVWPGMDGMVCLSILLEGGVTVSNNFTKRRQNGSKIGTRDNVATHLR